MSGLKVQLSLTIVSLLVLGMLLINMVTMSLWQQDAVEREVQRLQLLLEVASQGIDQYELDSGLGIQEIRMVMGEENIECYRVHLVEEDLTFPEDCKNDLALREHARETENTGERLIAYNGTALGVFTLGRRLVRLTQPVFSGGVQVGSIAVEKDLRPLYAELRQKERIVFVYIVLNTIILATIGFFRLVRLVIRPLDRLVEVADTYSQNVSFMLMNEKPGSEFGRLTSSLNGMLCQIEEDNAKLRSTVGSLEKAHQEAVKTRKKMILTEKMASMGRLSAGLAHEIGNPLAIVQGYIELLGQKSTTSEEREQFASRAGKEVARIDSLLKQLLDVSRKPNCPKALIHVHEVLTEIVQFITDQRKNSHIELLLLLDAVDDVVVAERDGLKQIFLNCLLNSIDAIGEGSEQKNGWIQVSTELTNDGDGDFSLQVAITDNGYGIDASDMDNIFEPFFTRKEPGKGTGLGLAVSHSLIENIGGTIRLEKNEPMGTRAVIELPLENKDTLQELLDG